MDKYKLRSGKLGDLAVIPMRGGMVTVRDRALLEYAGKSLVQNMRCWHPGFETRPGYDELSTVATDASADSILNMYQFSKGKVSEQAVFVQYGDGDLHKQNGSIPTQYTGAFGTEVYDGSSGQLPAAFTNINDYMVYSNGADQHQIYAGKTQRIGAFEVVRSAAPHPMFPDEGEDYWEQVTDGLSTTVAVLDSLGDYATDDDAIYIMTKTPVDLFNITVTLPNGSTAELLLSYWNSASGWANLAITDNTDSGGATLAQSGTVVLSLTAPNRALEIPRMMFEQSGFWYRLSLDTGDSLDAEVEISEVTYDCESFTNLVNVWNGVPTDLIEAHHVDDSESLTNRYGTSAITISAMTSSDTLLVSSPFQLEGIYFDFGDTPSTTGITVTIKYWDGSAFQDVTENDGTGGWTESGWIHFGRQTGEFKRQYADTRYFAYWYEITVSATIGDSVVLSVLGMPYFNVSEFGQVGRINATWKNRALYSFDRFPRDIYVTQSSDHMFLNGSDFGILQPGDGRDNASVAAVNFHNEIMVFQEERGKAGGCVTIFEGYSPATFGKMVLSTKVGSFSPKSVDVVDGSKTSLTKRDMVSQTMVFFLSHYGVFMSDGRIVTGISDDIQNYFDPRFAECIRTGYENEMWLSYDSVENLIKIGIVSGSSATTCNKFFCYDLVDGVWYEDVYNDSLSVFTEAQSDTGQFHTIQMAGGSTSGFVYRMNYGTNDVGNAIEAKMTWEFSHGPFLVDIEEVLTRVKVQGDTRTYAWSAEENDVVIDSKTGSMAAKVINQTIRRNRHLQKVGEIPWASFTITSDTLDVPIYLYDMGIIAKATEYK